MFDIYFICLGYMGTLMPNLGTVEFIIAEIYMFEETDRQRKIYTYG